MKSKKNTTTKRIPYSCCVASVLTHPFLLLYVCMFMNASTGRKVCGALFYFLCLGKYSLSTVWRFAVARRVSPRLGGPRGLNRVESNFHTASSSRVLLSNTRISSPQRTIIRNDQHHQPHLQSSQLTLIENASPSTVRI